jgi:hypothetical protein
MDPYAGKPRAVLPDGTVEDIDEAVGRPRVASDGQWVRWPASTGPDSCAGSRNLIADNAERPATLCGIARRTRLPQLKVGFVLRLASEHVDAHRGQQGRRTLSIRSIR